jgi:hypothetical protein
MAVTVKAITLWRQEVENKPGILAKKLDSFAAGSTDLQVVMGHRYPANKAKAAIELYPVIGKKLNKVAEAAGLSASSIPTLLVEGDNNSLGNGVPQPRLLRRLESI